MSTPELKYVPVSQLIESTSNYRRRHDPDAHAELVHSVQRMGVLTPLVVRQVTQDASWLFEVAAGHRRLRAAREAGVAEVPVVVRAMDDREFAEIMIAENLQRMDPDPLDEAEGFQAMIDTLGYDVATLASRFGKSESYIRHRLVLTNVSEKVRTALQESAIELGHAVLLARVSHERQDELLATELLASYKMVRPITREDVIDGETYLTDVEGGDDVAEHLEGAEAVTFYPARTKTTVGELRRAMGQTLLPLAPVKWDHDDATLVPSAGACSSCPKCTAANPMLFEELSARENRCTDARCYGAKRTAWILRRLAEVQANLPKTVAVSRSYYGTKVKLSGVKVLRLHTDYTEAKAGQRGAVPAVVVVNGDDINRWDGLGDLIDVKLVQQESAAKASAQTRTGRTPAVHSTDEHKAAGKRFMLGLQSVIVACQASETELADHCTALFQEDMATPNGVHAGWEMRQVLRAAMAGTLGTETVVEIDEDEEPVEDEFEDAAAFVQAVMQKRPPVSLRTTRLVASLARARLSVPYYNGWDAEPPIEAETATYAMPAALVAIGAESNVDAAAVWRAALTSVPARQKATKRKKS